MLVFSSITFLLAGKKYFEYFFTTKDRYFFLSHTDFEKKTFSSEKTFGLKRQNNNLLIETLDIGINNLTIDIMYILFYPIFIPAIIGLIKYSYMLGLILKLQYIDINNIYINAGTKISDLLETFVEGGLTIVFLALITRAAISVIFKYREDTETPRAKIFIKHLISLARVYILYLPITFLLAVWEAYNIINY